MLAFCQQSRGCYSLCHNQLVSSRLVQRSKEMFVCPHCETLHYDANTLPVDYKLKNI